MLSVDLNAGHAMQVYLNAGVLSAENKMNAWAFIQEITLVVAMILSFLSIYF